MSKAEGRSGVLSLQSAGWNKFECKVERNVFSFAKVGAKKSNEITCLELAKSVIVREYPQNFFKTMDFPFSITIGELIYVFRTDKETERSAWFETFALHCTCFRVLASHWATKCPKGSSVSKVFKPRFFILHSDRVSYYKEENWPETGFILLKPGVSDVKVLWRLAKKYTISISPEPNAPLPLHMCFNLFEHYDKWIYLLINILSLDYTPPPLNPNLYQPGTIVKQGLLEKKGERNKAWQKRFFSVKTGEAGEDSMIEYRKFNQFGKVCGEIEISDRTAILGLPKDDKKNHMFALTSKVNGRIFYLSASEENEKKSWIEMLTSVSRTPKYAFSLCEGFLQKRGRVNTAYRERYFVLLYDRIVYYKNKRDDVCAGEIILSPETTICPDEDEEHGFTLSRFVGTSRMYVILTIDAAMCRYWMTKVSAVIEGKLTPSTKSNASAVAPYHTKPPSSPSLRPALTLSSLTSPTKTLSSSSSSSSSYSSFSSLAPFSERASTNGDERRSEISAACVCGNSYHTIDEQSCRRCGIARPKPLNHANKIAINNQRKRPMPRVFNAEETEVVGVLVVGDRPSPRDKQYRDTTTTGKGLKLDEQQRCSVGGCGKWEFQAGVCKSHLSGANGGSNNRPAVKDAPDFSGTPPRKTLDQKPDPKPKTPARITPPRSNDEVFIAHGEPSMDDEGPPPLPASMPWADFLQEDD